MKQNVVTFHEIYNGNYVAGSRPVSDPLASVGPNFLLKSSNLHAKRGLSETPSSSTICAICLDSLIEEEAFEWTGCAHRFHDYCVESLSWVGGALEAPTCPLCRAPDGSLGERLRRLRAGTARPAQHFSSLRPGPRLGLPSNGQESWG
ncbi:uncharacterized protein PGTG_13527 [Puccinia graminis f. sp. tritici CRL 75-36-700-3]|uniref:RING-type domain-containing protein n=1 Tax=Puccinia graminis f. sp. tritici (strain CRL 75-36-700-3 / race SCCL) TaxID=418459 RepID=E3KTP0_PUCGT|nr:uncharacterized protein PGTG_13527 [Puccinia graminis f. sp. tritici CRL 75-36-700-3]EFP87741.2 hypothetical protein PGTG_13527 [Puccinia graminis f. sp. tritici CRL 75-36-700-3]